MSPEVVNSLIIDSKDFDHFNDDPSIKIEEVPVELGEKIWVKYSKLSEDDDLSLNNISVSVASAITS
jgi:hypothetical protein